MVLCFMLLLITYDMPQCIISDPAYYFLGSVKSVFSALLFPDIGLIPNRLTQLIINMCKGCSGVINKIFVRQKKKNLKSLEKTSQGLRPATLFKKRLWHRCISEFSKVYLEPSQTTKIEQMFDWVMYTTPVLSHTTVTNVLNKIASTFITANFMKGMDKSDCNSKPFILSKTFLIFFQCPIPFFLRSLHPTKTIPHHQNVF